MASNIWHKNGRVTIDFEVYLKEGEHMETPSADQTLLVISWYRRQAELAGYTDIQIRYVPRKLKFRMTYKTKEVGHGNITTEAEELACPSEFDSVPLVIGEKSYTVIGSA